MNEQTVVEKKRNSPPRGAGGAKKSRRYSPADKLRAVRLHLEEGFPKRDVCQEMGMSVSCLCLWVTLYRQQGEAGLQSAYACKRGAKLPAAITDKIVELKQQNPTFGIKRISQVLRRCFFLPASPETVRQRLHETEPPFRRMECAPGQELQVDFGLGAWVMDQGKRRRPHLFRAVLSHSRKGYSEVVWRQTSESFLRCLENSFRYFGGVTATVVIDNLKAGVLQADWYDPELNPKLEEFARYYGTVILPTKPAMPRHKGKVEAGVKYAQNNAVKGRTFESLTAQNTHLADWEKNVADTRIHGTTRRQVGKIFEEVERTALQPLPAGLFPVFEEAQRTVPRDGYVEFKKAYYSAPPEYVARQVWVRQETRLLRLYNSRREQIALHALAEPGKFTTDPAHLHSRKRHSIEHGADYLLDRCRMIGPLTGSWAEAMHQSRGPQSLRVMLGLLQLAEKHPAAQLEKAAGLATHHGAWRLRDLKRLLALPGNVVQMDFLETHPLIRSLEAYRIEPTPNPNP